MILCSCDILYKSCAGSTQDTRMILGYSPSSGSVRRNMNIQLHSVVIMATLILGLFFLPCNSMLLNDEDTVVINKFPLMEPPSSGTDSQIDETIFSTHHVAASDKELSSTSFAYTLGRKLKVEKNAIEEELSSRGKKSNGNGQMGHHHHHHNHHHQHRRSAGHAAEKHLDFHGIGPASSSTSKKSTHLGHILGSSEGYFSGTEWNSLASEKMNTVSWHKPREKYDQPTFHVDYSGPKTHPPKNN